MGICGQNNKSTVWNKHTGGKIQNCLHCKIRNSSANGLCFDTFFALFIGFCSKKLKKTKPCKFFGLKMDEISSKNYNWMSGKMLSLRI